jgi:hypothetical protein
MAYTTINKPSEYFNTKLFTGNGSTQSITGVGHQPDLSWFMHRNSATSWNHSIHDSVRGSTKYIASNASTGEVTDVNSVTSFDSDGFSIGSFVKINENGTNFVSWNWKANGAGVSNTDGDITSTVSANTTSGFSIVKYTGTGANATVGHGLGAVPKFIIVKALNDPRSWITYHSSTGASGGIDFNAAGAFNSNSTLWNNTTPTSSVVHLGTSVQSNSTYDYIMYCFADVKGFSKFGSYTGNGNVDGPFVYTGFKPAFVMLKEALGASVAGSWLMIDNKRDTFNLAGTHIAANSAGAEQTAASRSPTFGIDFISNGFKLRGLHDEINTSDYTYIYMAFAENPLVGTNNIPATAR